MPHRGIKGSIRCVCGFKSHDVADRFCRKHGELRDLLRLRFARGVQFALEIMQNA